MVVAPGLYTLHNLSTQKGSVTVRAVNTLQTCQTKTPCGVSRWLLGAEVAATESELHPLQIVSLEAGAQEGIRAKLSGSDDALSSALVSICITRFVSPKNGEHALGNVLSAKSFPRNRGADALLLPSPSAGELVPERQLSEEVRYVLDRRQAIAERPPCPGSVIRPPSLLIYPQRLQTPWSNDAVARLDRKSKLGVPSE